MISGSGGSGTGYRFFFFFLFQAEDGRRVHCVTGVQTCALPIYHTNAQLLDRFLVIAHSYDLEPSILVTKKDLASEIGRASCRERV